MEHQLAEKGGVETEEQAEFLASIGCGRLQGFFFGKPQPLAGAFAHIKAKQIGIETRRWHPYYDKADSLIYATDELLAVMDLRKMPSITVELLFESSSSAKYNHQGLLHGTRKMLAEYEQNIVYPKDREQYHKYAAPRYHPAAPRDVP